MRPARRLVPALRARRFAAASAATLFASLFAGSSTETAEANGDTRTLNLYHSHTGESIQATFRVNGSYDPAVLERLNYFLRDWRNNDRTRMDARLFDVVWEVYRTAGASQPIVIFSAYRSPETNAMLRRRSSAVAEYSQHMLGKAMDTTMPGMSMEQIREIGMKLQRGGVGYYSRENFVHLDVGNVRSWPRMSYEQLARLFPDGKSAHLASNGRSLPRYEEARAEIASRGGVVSDEPVAMPGGGFFAWLFGGGRDRQEQAEAVRGAAPQRGLAPQPAATQVAALEKPVRLTAAERRAAAKAAKAAQPAPALAAIEAANQGDASRSRTLLAALAPQAPTLPPQSPTLPPQALATPPQVASYAAASSAAPPSPALRERAQTEPAKDAAPRREPEREAPPIRDRAEPAARPLMAAAPLPPARPGDLIPAPALAPVAVAYADVPTPPARPGNLTTLAALTFADAAAAAPLPPRAEIAKADAAKAEAAKANAVTLARAASLPVIITRGPKDQQSLPAAVLSYAAGPRPTPRTTAAGEAPVIVSARLDRSNFRELTSETPAAQSAPSSLLGQALTGLRQAARIIPDALSAAPSSGYQMAFGAASAVASSTSFTKASPAPSVGEVVIVDASEAHPTK